MRIEDVILWPFEKIAVFIYNFICEEEFDYESTTHNEN